MLAGIARMIEAAEQARGRYADWAQRAARLYVPLVHSAAAIAFVGWLLAGAELRDAVLIAAGAWHQLRAEEGMRFLCCCAPPYSHDDTYFE